MSSSTERAESEQAAGSNNPLTKACVRCRQLKLACRRNPQDGDEGDCQRCAETGSECIYVARRRGPTTPSLTKKLQSIEAEVTRLQSDIGSVNEMRRRMDQLEQRLQSLQMSATSATGAVPRPSPQGELGAGMSNFAPRASSGIDALLAPMSSTSGSAPLPSIQPDLIMSPSNFWSNQGQRNNGMIGSGQGIPALLNSITLPTPGGMATSSSMHSGPSNQQHNIMLPQSQQQHQQQQQPSQPLLPHLQPQSQIQSQLNPDPMPQNNFTAARTRSNSEDDIEALNEIENGEMALGLWMRDPRMHEEPEEGSSGRGKPWDTDKLDAEMELGCRAAFEVFDTTCKSATNFLNPNDATWSFDVARTRSPLMFWSIVAVGSRDQAGLERVFDAGYRNMLASLRRFVGGPKPTFWDICGAMIYNKYLAAIRHLGQLVDMAYDVGLHRTFDSMRDTNNPTPEEVRDVRMWVTIWVQDHFGSAFSGRPPFIHNTSDVAQQAQWLVSLPSSLPNDRRLVASFEYEMIIRDLVDDVAKVDPLGPDWPQRANVRLGAVEQWLSRWLLVGASQSSNDEMFSMLSAMKVNYHLTRLYINSIPLRGLKRHQQLLPVQVEYLKSSIECARALCKLCHEEFQPPKIKYTGQTSIYGFVAAAVFILKAHRLDPAGVVEPAALDDVQNVIDVIKHLKKKSHANLLATLLSRAKGMDSSSTMGEFGGMDATLGVPAGPPSDSDQFDLLAWTTLTHDEPFDVTGFPFQTTSFPDIDAIMGLP